MITFGGQSVVTCPCTFLPESAGKIYTSSPVQFCILSNTWNVQSGAKCIILELRCVSLAHIWFLTNRITWPKIASLTSIAFALVFSLFFCWYCRCTWVRLVKIINTALYFIGILQLMYTDYNVANGRLSQYRYRGNGGHRTRHLQPGCYISRCYCNIQLVSLAHFAQQTHILQCISGAINITLHMHKRTHQQENPKPLPELDYLQRFITPIHKDTFS